jgi:hypothetical protein
MPFVELEFPASDRFEAEACLGSGGMGTVFRVYDREAGSHVAIKLLDRQHPEALIRFKNEFRKVQDIEHDNLVSLGELGQLGNVWYFTMELVEGTPLREYIAKPVPPPHFDDQRLRSALAQLVRAIAALHRHGKVHRDVKPSNVLVDDNGRLVLIDFGLLLDTENPDHLTATNRVVGTTTYMSPEQSRPNCAEPASDLYSVGVILYEALTGRLPFSGSAVDVMLAKRQEMPRPPRELTSGIPRDLDALCMDLLATDPAVRPPTDEVVRRLGDLSGDDIPAIDVHATHSMFVGRERELKLLSTTTADRIGKTIILRAESGIGKSTLVTEFATNAMGDGTLVLRGRCFERESVPFKGVDGVVDALARHLKELPSAEADALVPKNAGLLAQAFPALRRIGTFREFPRQGRTSPRGLRLQVFAALRDLLSRMADKRALVIAIDDMQWASADSWAVLDSLMKPPGAPRMLLLLTTRPVPKDRVHTLPGDVETIELEALRPAEARALAAELLRIAGQPEQGAAALAHEADGHPLFIQELVRYVASEDTASADSGELPRLGDALRARFERLSGQAAEVLYLVAAAGAPISQTIIASAADISFSEFLRVVRELRAARLVRTGGTRGTDTIEHFHARISKAVLDEIGDEDLRALHTALADAIEDSGTAEHTPELAVHHLIAADKRERASHYAQLAARRAMEALAFDRAANLYAIALDAGTHTPAAQHELALARATALVNTGRGTEAAEIYTRAAQTADQAGALDFTRRAAEQLLIAGEVDRGRSLLAELFAAQNIQIPTSPRTAMLKVSAKYLWARIRGLGYRERDTDQLAESQLVLIDTCWAGAMGLSLVDTLRGGYIQALHLRKALDAGEPMRVCRALTLQAGFEAARGQRAAKRVDKLLALASELADKLSDPPSIARVQLARGFKAYLGGDISAATIEFKRAHDLSQEALESEGSERVSWENNTALLYLMLARRFAGQTGIIASEIARILDSSREHGHRLLTVSLLCNVTPYVELAAGNVDQARADVAEAMRDWPESGFYRQHLWALCARAEADIYADRPTDALERLERYWDDAKRWGHFWPVHTHADMLYLRGRASLAAALQRQTDRSKLLASARRDASKLAKMGSQYSTPAALLLRAGAAALEGKEGAAVKHLGAARDVCAVAQLIHHEAAARWQLSALIGGVAADDEQRAATRLLGDAGVSNQAGLARALAPGFPT